EPGREGCLHHLPRPAPHPDPEAPPADAVPPALLGPLGPTRVDFPAPADGVVRPGAGEGGPVGRSVRARIVEIELPLAAIGVHPGDELVMAVEALAGGETVERIPRSGYLPLAVPGPDFERIHWRV
ncbi:MAG TPA: hypothetical protein PLL32_10015, partial [Anaeromyxobacteraceae bacterium]|nr:hypothetical protein [Anaeromyxobacteraceae bacterium]